MCTDDMHVNKCMPILFQKLLSDLQIIDLEEARLVCGFGGPSYQ